MNDYLPKVLILEAQSPVLLALGQQLLAHDVRPMMGVQSPSSPGYGNSSVLVDFLDVVAMSNAMHGMDVVVIPSFHSADARARHALVLEAAERAGVRHVIRLSSIGAERNSTNDWLRLNGQADNRVRSSGLVYTIFECAPLMQSIHLQTRTEPSGVERLLMPLGASSVCWLDMVDLAACIAERARQFQPPSMTYQLTGRQGLRGDQVAQAMANALGRTVVYLNTPEHAYLASRASQGVSKQELVWDQEYYRAIRAGAFELPYGDIYRLLLTPPHTLSVYLARTETQDLFDPIRL